VQEPESSLIAARREAFQLDTSPESNVALALSGGGIRSATFSLGLLQALAKIRRSPPGEPDRGAKLLNEIDILSTVSGGGYTGIFLGSLFMPRQLDLTVPDPLDSEANAGETPVQAAARAMELLGTTANADDASLKIGDSGNTLIFHPLRWLRENGRYLAPGGSGDMLYMSAYYLRSLIGVQFVLLMALLAAVLTLYPLRRLTQAILAFVQSRTDAGLETLVDPAGWCVVSCQHSFTMWWSPLFIWPVAVLLLVGAPLVLSYWIAYRQEGPQFSDRSAEEWSIELSPLLLGAVACWTEFRFHSALEGDPLRILLAYVGYLGLTSYLIMNIGLPLYLRNSWDASTWRDGLKMAIWRWKTSSALVADSRLLLTKLFAAALGLTIALTVIALVDSLGQSLFAWIAFNKGNSLTATISGATGVGVFAYLLRKFSGLSGGDTTKSLIGLVHRFRQAVALVAALIIVLAMAIALVVLVQAAMFSPVLASDDAITERGLAVFSFARYGWLLTACGLLIAMTWASESFLNHSTFHRFYAARLTRTFLGAANFVRLGQLAEALRSRKDDLVRKLFVSESHKDDDLSLRSYYRREPESRSVGPLHLINVTVNENLSLTSNLVREDRKSFPLCIGPEGIRAGDTLYQWGASTGDIGSRVSESPNNSPLALPHSMELSDTVERLSLGSWCAISGAAASTGMGRQSGTGYAMLAWIFNARLGYWWHPADIMSTGRRVSALRTFDLVRQEFLARFYGRRGSPWNLSDGGHFDNTGAYELIRRRVPLIICSDNGADPDYEFSDLENLVRRVRIDFGYEVTLLDRPALNALYSAPGLASDASLTRLIGATDEFRNHGGDNRDRCALLGMVSDGKGSAPFSVILIIKPTPVSFAPEDVRLYARGNSTFPQQTTRDQFFDEAQWESYRRLGEAIGSQLFSEHWHSFFRKLSAQVCKFIPRA
jgi:hypothetical protein